MLKSQSWEAKETRQEAKTLRNEFDAVNYDAFCNCLQHPMLLNPGVKLNFWGISVDHTISDGVLTDICQPSDPHLVDLSNPDLKAFDPWAPYMAKDSEATESDKRGGNVAGDEIPGKQADAGAEVAASSCGANDAVGEAETMAPPPRQ
jgi:hypothetical protein